VPHRRARSNSPRTRGPWVPGTKKLSAGGTRLKPSLRRRFSAARAADPGTRGASIRVSKGCRALAGTHSAEGCDPLTDPDARGCRIPARLPWWRRSESLAGSSRPRESVLPRPTARHRPRSRPWQWWPTSRSPHAETIRGTERRPGGAGHPAPPGRPSQPGRPANGGRRAPAHRPAHEHPPPRRHVASPSPGCSPSRRWPDGAPPSSRSARRCRPTRRHPSSTLPGDLVGTQPNLHHARARARSPTASSVSRRATRVATPRQCLARDARRERARSRLEGAGRPEAMGPFGPSAVAPGGGRYMRQEVPHAPYQ
jgi:hypothetical protein